MFEVIGDGDLPNAIQLSIVSDSFKLYHKVNLIPSYKLQLYALSEIPPRERGDFLEDTVGNVFSNWGFDVQKRVKLKDKFDIEHEIDVLASKKEAFGTVSVAVECKYVTTPTGIKEIRNFHDKLSSLGITKGILVSTAGLTSDAEAQAKVMGIELWDLAALQDKISKIEAPMSRIADALPLSPDIVNHFLPPHIMNSSIFSLTKRAQVRYSPYFLVGYHYFSQQKAGGTFVTLESKGTIAVDGVNGTVVDSRIDVGEQPTLPIHGIIVGLIFKQTSTITVDNLTIDDKYFEPKIELVNPKIREKDAKSIVQREITKNLSMTHKYYVGSSTRFREIKPHKKDIEITECNLLNIPLVYEWLSAMGKNYLRTIQGVTGASLRDETYFCNICNKNVSQIVCEICGNVVCKEHTKQCVTCNRPVCNRCVVSKGTIFKKFYCPEHIPE